MTTDLLIGILASVIATVLLGGATYKYILKKKDKNSGIRQENGTNQIALQKSKQNSINIGGDISKNEKGNKSE
jgi:hypothetical protein